MTASEMACAALIVIAFLLGMAAAAAWRRQQANEIPNEMDDIRAHHDEIAREVGAIRTIADRALR